jgi:hypothetical protein
MQLGRWPVRTWNVGINGFTLLVECSWCRAGFSSRIQVLLTTKFFARELSDGYSINIRKLSKKMSEFAYRSRMPWCVKGEVVQHWPNQLPSAYVRS